MRRSAAAADGTLRLRAVTDDSSHHRARATGHWCSSGSGGARWCSTQRNEPLSVRLGLTLTATSVVVRPRRRSDGIGRRAGLKIRCPQGRAGSIPASGTTAIVDDKRLHPRMVVGLRRSPIPALAHLHANFQPARRFGRRRRRAGGGGGAHRLSKQRTNVPARPGAVVAPRRNGRSSEGIWRRESTHLEQVAASVQDSGARDRWRPLLRSGERKV